MPNIPLRPHTPSAADMPTITDSGHQHSIYSLANMATPTGYYAGTTGGMANPLGAGWLLPPPQIFGQFPGNVPADAQAKPLPKQKKARNEEVTMSRRLVQVFIADPDENVPLESSLLYSGDQKLTDATDQELFFEIDMKTILDAHNAKRVTMINKKVKERVENLEPVKIRDLRMVVVNVATF